MAGVQPLVLVLLIALFAVHTVHVTANDAAAAASTADGTTDADCPLKKQAAEDAARVEKQKYLNREFLLMNYF